jgi:type II secretion system (T2SS) protein M
MSRFPSLSAWFQRLSRRERRVVALGALVSILALTTVWAVLPLARHWGEREAAILAKESQLGRLRALVQDEATIRSGLVVRQREGTALRERLLTGATPALAASEVQALLQAYADHSRVSLDRVDVVANPGAADSSGLPAIPVRLSGQGDIYGLSELLNRLQYGGKLLVVDELQVTGGNPSYAPDLLSFSIRLHGAYSQE